MDLREISRTEEYGELLRQLNKLAAHLERELVDAGRSQPVETIRFMAGKVNGVRLTIDMLTKVRQYE